MVYFCLFLSLFLISLVSKFFFCITPSCFLSSLLLFPLVGPLSSFTLSLSEITLCYFSCILLTLSFSGYCRGAVSRFMMNTVEIMRRPRGCCWSSIRSGASGHVYWWEGTINTHDVQFVICIQLLTYWKPFGRRSVFKSKSEEQVSIFAKRWKV